jgi:hypothetical protein
MPLSFRVDHVKEIGLPHKRHYGTTKNLFAIIKTSLYSVLRRFMQAKFDNGGSILSSSLFMTQLPKKIRLASEMVKIDSK